MDVASDSDSGDRRVGGRSPPLREAAIQRKVWGAGRRYHRPVRERKANATKQGGQAHPGGNAGTLERATFAIRLKRVRFPQCEGRPG